MADARKADGFGVEVKTLELCVGHGASERVHGFAWGVEPVVREAIGEHGRADRRELFPYTRLVEQAFRRRGPARAFLACRRRQRLSTVKATGDEAEHVASAGKHEPPDRGRLHAHHGICPVSHVWILGRDEYDGVEFLEHRREADELAPEAVANDANRRIGQRAACPRKDGCLVLSTPGGRFSIAMANRHAARLPGAAVVVGDRAKTQLCHIGGEARILALRHADRALDDQVSDRCGGRVGRALNLVPTHFHSERLALDEHVLVFRWRYEVSEGDTLCNGVQGVGMDFMADAIPIP